MRKFTVTLFIAAALVVAAVIAYPALERALNEIKLPLQHEDIIRQQAAEKKLDPALVAAVIYAESKFSDRTSHAGARGLMQILPSTARFIARRSGGTAFIDRDLATPQVNISYGCYYLRYLIDRYGGNQNLAIAAYNAGETNVDRWLVAATEAGHPLTVERIPFAETRAYVRKVLQVREDYRDTYRSELGL